jgi:hypothetical protein
MYPWIYENPEFFYLLDAEKNIEGDSEKLNLFKEFSYLTVV